MDQMLEPDGAGSASCERNPDLGPDLSGDDLLEFLNSVEMSEEEREELSTLPQDPMKPNGERPVLPAFAVAAATAANWVMYVGTTPTGQRYIGITSNFLQRQAAHLQNGMKTSQIQLGRSFYYAQAKGAEQVLIEAGRSIDRKSVV